MNSTSKSQLCILKEQLQDKMGRQTILQTLKKSRFPQRPVVSQRFISSNGLFHIHTGIPVQLQCGLRNPCRIFDSFVPRQKAEVVLERKKLQVEAQSCPMAASSTLVELLKLRHESLELTALNNQQAFATRTICDMTKDFKEEEEMESVEQNWTYGMKSQ